MPIMTHFLTVYVCTILVAPNPAGSLLVTGSRRSGGGLGRVGAVAAVVQLAQRRLVSIHTQIHTNTQ